jgi:hypothetical protein
MANSFDPVADDDVTEEVPPPELNPEGKKQDQARAGMDDARFFLGVEGSHGRLVSQE